MRQTVTVVREYSHGCVEVELVRASACGSDCGSCQGCGAPKEIIRVKARGGAGKQVGEKVVIESSSGRILGLAALVYLTPLVLFFAGYAFGALIGGLGFALGLALLIPVNKVVGKHTVYEVLGG